MSKCVLVKALREEVGQLYDLINELEDKSALCFPEEYTCSECLKRVIINLRRLEKKTRRYVEINNKNNMFLNVFARR